MMSFPPPALVFSHDADEQSCASPGSAGVCIVVLWWFSRALRSRRSYSRHAHRRIHGGRGENASESFIMIIFPSSLVILGQTVSPVLQCLLVTVRTGHVIIRYVL